MENEKSKEEILEICKNLSSKLIGTDIEPTKYEDIPAKLAEILSRHLKKSVTVNGTGLDGKDMIIDIK